MRYEGVLRMKKVFAVVLVLCLMGTTVGVSEKEPGLNLLWDIPFGSKLEEFIEMSYQRTGIEFTVNEGGVMYELKPAEEIEMYGIPVDFTVIVGKEEGLKYVYIYLGKITGDAGDEQTENKEEAKDTFLNAIEPVQNVYNALCETYGIPTGGRLSSGVGANEMHYSYPLSDDGRLDFDTALEIALSGETFTVETFWNNIYFRIFFLTYIDREDSIFKERYWLRTDGAIHIQESYGGGNLELVKHKTGFDEEEGDYIKKPRSVGF